LPRFRGRVGSGHHRHHHGGKLAIDGTAPDRVTFAWLDVSARAGTNTSHVSSVRTDVRGPDARAVRSTFASAALRSQARDALVGLGWKTSIAGAAVDDAIAAAGVDAGIEVVIRAALRRCPRPTS
jgi:hypothetical protein